MVPFGLFVVGDGRTLLNANALYACCGFTSENSEWTPGTTELTDTVDFMYPNELHTAESYKSGVVPFWNPYQGGGLDYSSNSQSSIFHPAKLLFLLVGPLTAHTAGVLLSMFCLVLFSYVLLKRVGLKWLPASIGALSYLSTPWLLFWAEWNTIFWIMASWPLLLYLLYNRKTSSVRWQRFQLVLIAFVLGLQFYFGHLQFSLFAVGIVTMWFLIEFIKGSAKKRVFAEWGIVMIITLLIASVTLVNSIAMLSEGHRTSSTRDSLNTEKIIEFDVKPLTYPVQISTDKSFYIHSAILLETTRLVILVSIVLLGVKIVRRSKFQTIKQTPHFLLVLLGLTIVGVGFGWSLPGFDQLITSIPVVKGLTPHYFIAIAVMSVPFLAAFLFNQWLTYRSKKRTIFESRHYIFAAVSVIAVLYAVILAYIFTQDLKIVSISWLACIPLIFIIFMKNAHKISRVIVSISVVAILLVNIWVYMYAFLPAPSKDSFTVGSPAMQCISDDATTRGIKFPRVLSVLPPNSHFYYHLSTLNIYDPFYPQHTKDFNDALNYPLKQRVTFGDNALITVNFDKTDWNEALGVNYQIRYLNEAAPTGYKKVCSDERYVSYKSTTNNEVIYSASKTLQLTEKAQLEAVRTGNINKGVVLQSSLSTREYVPGTVSDRVIKGNKISFVSTSDSSQLVFIAQSFDDGWTAKVNGKQTPILKADYKFMAIEIPAGVQNVELSFKPKYFHISLWLVGFGIITGLTYAAMDLRSKRQTRKHLTKR